MVKGNEGDESAVPTTETGDGLNAAYDALLVEVGQLRLRNQRCNCPNCPNQHHFIGVTAHSALMHVFEAAQRFVNSAPESLRNWTPVHDLRAALAIASSIVITASALAEGNAPANKRDTNDAESVGS